MLLTGCASISKEQILEYAEKYGVPATEKLIDKAEDEGRLGSANAADLRELLEKYQEPFE
jgi:hypothetical protein